MMEQPFFPFRISVRYCGTGQWRDLRIWLLDNVHNRDSYVIDGADMNNYQNRVVRFAYEKDAIMFALRWS